jgi:hypothetical protein
MNINTGLVSPQFHVVYDDHFSTTKSYETNSLPTNWLQLFTKRSDNVLAENPIMRDAHVLGPEWDDPIPSHPSNLSDSPLAREDPVDSSFTHLTSISSRPQREIPQSSSLQRELPMMNLPHSLPIPMPILYLALDGTMSTDITLDFGSMSWLPLHFLTLSSVTLHQLIRLWPSSQSR